MPWHLNIIQYQNALAAKCPATHAMVPGPTTHASNASKGSSTNASACNGLKGHRLGATGMKTTGTEYTDEHTSMGRTGMENMAHGKYRYGALGAWDARVWDTHEGHMVY